MTVNLQNNFTLRGILSAIIGVCLALITFYLIIISPAIILSIGWIFLILAILTLATSIAVYITIQQTDNFHLVYRLDGLRYLTWFLGNSLLWIAVCILISAMLLRFFGASFWILAICAGGFAVSTYTLQGIFFIRKVIWYRLCWTIPDVVDQVADNPDHAILLSKRYALAIENNTEEQDFIGHIRLALRTPSAKIVEFDKLARKQIHLYYLPDELWMRSRALSPVFLMTTLVSLFLFGIGWGMLQATAEPVRHYLEPLIVAQRASESAETPFDITSTPDVTETPSSNPTPTPPANQSQQEGGGEGDSQSQQEGDGQGDSQSQQEGDGQGDSQSQQEGDGQGDSQSQQEGDEQGDSQSQQEGDGQGDSQSQQEGDGQGDSQSQQEGDGQDDSQSQQEGDGQGDSQSQQEGDGQSDSQSQQEGDGQGDSQSQQEGDEQGDSSSQQEGNGQGDSQSRQEGDGQGDSQSQQEDDGQGDSQSQQEGDGQGDSQSQQEGDGEGDSQSQQEGDGQGDSNGQNGGGSGDSESGNPTTFGLGESTPIVSDTVQSIPTPAASGINPADRITVDVPPMRDPSRNPDDPREIDEDEDGTLESAETADNIDAIQETDPLATDEPPIYQRIPNWILELTYKE